MALDLKASLRRSATQGSTYAHLTEAYATGTTPRRRYHPLAARRETATLRLTTFRLSPRTRGSSHWSPPAGVRGPGSVVARFRRTRHYAPVRRIVTTALQRHLCVRGERQRRRRYGRNRSRFARRTPVPPGVTRMRRVTAPLGHPTASNRRDRGESLGRPCALSVGQDAAGIPAHRVRCLVDTMPVSPTAEY